MKKIISLMVGCALISTASFALGATANSGVITVVQSTYLGNDNKNSCDATPVVATLCNGQDKCTFTVNNTLCGDPEPGVPKTLTTYYRCDQDSYSAKTPENYTQLLSCLQGKKLSTSNQKR